MFVNGKYLIGRDFAFPDYKPRFPESYPYTIRRLIAQLEVFISEGKLRGRVIYEIIPKRRLSYIELNAEEMNILSTSHQRDYDGSILRLYFNPPLEASQNTIIEVSYETKPRKGAYFIRPDKEKGNTALMVWTQGESEDNRYWLPLPDNPNIKFPTELEITVPRGMIAISNGVLMDVRDLNDKSTWRWVFDYPHSPYLIAFAAGEFEKLESDCNGVKLEYYWPKGRYGDPQVTFAATCDAVKFFSEYTGVKYPYPVYKQVAVHEFIYGGMENTTVTILTDTTLHTRREECPYDEWPCRGREDFSSDGLVAHELAHQWFGDLVTTRDWGNIWLNEAFATYMEALYTMHAKGVDEFIYELYSNLKAYLNEYRRYARPIVTRLYKYPEEMFDRHTYEKGSLVLHTLKNIIGEENFRKGIEDYLNKHRFSNADTEDLRKAMEGAYGEDLTWFFKQFVYSAGHPVLKVSWSWLPDESAIRLSISQAQGDDSYPIYKIPLEVKIVYEGNSEVRLLNIEEKEHVLHLNTPSKPKYICIDPKFKVLKVTQFDKPLEEAIGELNDEDVMCRIEAINALAKNASPRAVEALALTVEKDPFWGVAVEAANALGRIGGESAKVELLRLLKRVTHPRVRRSIIDALGNFRGDAEVAKVLLNIANDGKESDYVRYAALVSLGKLRIRDFENELIKALNYGGFNYMITQGALRGLSELGTDNAFKVVLSHTEPNKPTLVRATAVMALGKFIDRREAIDRLIELAKDDQFRVRFAVVATADEVKHPALLPTLDELASRDPDGRIRRLARETAKRIRDQLERGVEYQRLREEIEQIREEHRRIMEEIGKLEKR
ncbi:M1 family aminopeptidase [Caldivirga sp.]|uniref:M1 family aminopeptidase n=1 Tax=Caldivirga sp. TaxID=2080243 RepID=UPI003D1386D6